MPKTPEKTPLSVESVDFAKSPDGLVPAIVQDAKTGEVLMLAYQNREALEATKLTGDATFWSRSRNELWRKGATSGHTQRVKTIGVDCDADAILLQVDPSGPACHTGERTCFHRGLEGVSPPGRAQGGLAALETMLEARRTEAPEGSYVAKLYADSAKRHKKVGEEATELVIASLSGTREQIVGEAADLLFHTLVLLRAHGLGLAEVEAELDRRVSAPRRE